MTAGGALFLTGGNIEFHISIRANHRTNIAPVKNTALGREVSLECKERLADFGMDGNFGRGRANRSGFEDGVRQVLCGDRLCAARAVICIFNVTASVQNGFGGCAVELSRIQIRESVMRREAFPECAFAGRKCAVYRNNSHGHDVSSLYRHLQQGRL